jgi:hypothetical protein
MATIIDSGGGGANRGRTVTVGPRSPGGNKPAGTPPKKTGNGPSPLNKNTKKTTKKSSVSDAEKRAIARENAAKKAAGKRYLHQAANLESQATALKDALKTEFARNRDQNLTDISNNLNTQIGQLKEGFGKKYEGFKISGQDTEKATADVSEHAFSNLVRERQDSISSILEHGAGETDAVRSLLLGTRNWHANQSEANRSYFDTMQSINQGITDLNIDTKTGMSNAALTAESERERIWTDFYNRRSEAFTQLGNVKGQQAEFYGQAKEMGVKPGKGKVSAAEKAMKKAFKNSANELGKSYVQQGVPAAIQQWEGGESLDRRQANTDLSAAVTVEPFEKAEGATLRKW